MALRRVRADRRISSSLFEDFLEERCVPRSRSGIREYLETIGVEEYNPLEIIKKTKGRMVGRCT